jgi:aspartyl aminopeptidase
MYIPLGEYAIFEGEEYEFISKTKGKTAIVSYDPRSVEKGFQQLELAPERHLKYVTLDELSFIFQRKTIVIYKGDEFVGSWIKDNQIMLFTGYHSLYEKYNMNMRDRFDYWLYVDLRDVDEIRVEWEPLPQYMTKKEA